MNFFLILFYYALRKKVNVATFQNSELSNHLSLKYVYIQDAIKLMALVLLCPSNFISFYFSNKFKSAFSDEQVNQKAFVVDFFL
jgi:hypothetical protein